MDRKIHNHRGPKPRPDTIITTIVLPIDLVERLDCLASHRFCSRSHLLREAAQQLLASNSQDQEAQAK